MSAFIGCDGIGVWVSNGARDDFLDWFAAHRCVHGDARWEYCNSEGNRWTGCCLPLEDLIPRGELFVVSEEELAAATTEYWPGFAKLLGIIAQITRGEWHHDSSKAFDWQAE
jgi:hypothetical protein